MKRFKTAPLLGIIAATTVASLINPAIADGSKAYIPLGKANQVAVFDTDKYQITEQTQGDIINSHGSALTPDGQFLVAGSLTPRKNGKKPSKPTNMTADEHEAHHGGSENTASSDSQGTLYLIDTTNHEVVRQFDVPGPVHHVLVTADGRYAVSTHPMGGGISVVSLESGKLVASPATGPAPNYIVQNPQDGSLYVSNSGNETISEVDTENWFVRKNIRISGSPEHMVLDDEAKHLYVNDTQGGQAIALDIESGETVAKYPIGQSPHGIDLSADQSVLYATIQADNRLVAVNLSDETMQEAELGPAPYHLAVNSEDGKLLITSREVPQLWVVDQNRLNVLEKIPLAGIGHQIALDETSP